MYIEMSITPKSKIEIMKENDIGMTANSVNNQLKTCIHDQIDYLEMCPFSGKTHKV